jgi:hypothetical protein
VLTSEVNRKNREFADFPGAKPFREGSGKIKVEPILLWAPPAEDGLKGGLSDAHGGKIPLDARMGKARKAGKKKRRRRRSA